MTMRTLTLSSRSLCALFRSVVRSPATTEEKRRKAAEDRRVAREKAVEENMGLWQQEIVPDWRVVTKNPRLRRMWWAGVPTALRTTVWERVVGNPLTLKKGIHA
jgi:hypothetical protein